MKPVRGVLNVGARRLSHLDYGGCGPNVLLLHGLAGRATEWRTTAEWLVRDFRVVALDQRGHGESACADDDDFSRGAYVRDVVATIHALGRAPVVLIGQSMGGLNAYLTAARHPELVRALIVVEAGISTDPAMPAKTAAWLRSWPLPFPTLDAARTYFGGDSLAARTWTEVLCKTEDGYRPEFHAQDMAASVRDADDTASYEPEWKQIACPTLLVVGEHGWVRVDVERMIAARPETSLAVISDAAHDVHLEEPEAWRRAVECFLRRLAAGAS